MGLWRFSQARVFTRLLVGAFGTGILLAVGQVTGSANGVTCGDISGLTPCYDSAHLRAAYDVPSGVTGADRTIVVIGAYHNLTVNADLHVFDVRNSLPEPPGAVPVLAPDGFVGFDGSRNQKGWFQEDAIDLQMAHSIAPDANLVLVEARTSGDDDILSAIKYAIDNNLGDVISMSFSEAEGCRSAAFMADLHAAFQRAAAQGITPVAAAGDNGPMQPACDGTLVTDVGWPASDPLVTAVGGTHLLPDGSEQAWSDARGAGGGGFSKLYTRPAYQAPFQKNSEARGLPDVGWNASWDDATMVCFHGMCGPSFGTSLAAPEWAGVVALADQAAGHRLGAINEALYHAAKSHGASDRFHVIGEGWDTATGLGSPDVANLVDWIAAHF